MISETDRSAVTKYKSLVILYIKDTKRTVSTGDPRHPLSHSSLSLYKISILLLVREVLSNLRRENARDGIRLPVVFRCETGCSSLGGGLNVQVLPVLDLPRSKLDRDPGQSTQEIVQSRR